MFGLRLESGPYVLQASRRIGIGCDKSVKDSGIKLLDCPVGAQKHIFKAFFSLLTWTGKYF